VLDAQLANLTTNNYHLKDQALGNEFICWNCLNIISNN